MNSPITVHGEQVIVVSHTVGDAVKVTSSGGLDFAQSGSSWLVLRQAEVVEGSEKGNTLRHSRHPQVNDDSGCKKGYFIKQLT